MKIGEMWIEDKKRTGRKEMVRCVYESESYPEPERKFPTPSFAELCEVAQREFPSVPFKQLSIQPEYDADGVHCFYLAIRLSERIE